MLERIHEGRCSLAVSCAKASLKTDDVVAIAPFVFLTSVSPMASTSSSSTGRKLPNIVITGTPGTGKTSHAAAFVEASPFSFTHLNVGDIVKERGCHEGWNEEWQSYDVDDDRVCRAMKGAEMCWFPGKLMTTSFFCTCIWHIRLTKCRENVAAR